MGVSISSRGPDVDDGGRGSLRAVLGGQGHAAAAVRAACTPVNLLLAGCVAFGWLALVGWTGPGPEGWQARLCAELTQRPASCGAIRPAKDQSRVASAVARSLP